MPYSITREDASADSVALQNALTVIRASNGWDTPIAALLRELRDSIAAQVKPVAEEPTGDVVVFILGRPWWPREGGVHWSTYEHSNNPPTWGELIDEVDRDAIQIYRNEAELVPQSDGAGALPVSSSPETGEATSPPASSPERSWRLGYEQATKNTRERIYNRVAALKPQLITGVEKGTIDKALAQIEADVDDA